MKRPWISGALGTLAALLVAGALTWSPAAARPEGETPQTKDKDKPKTQEDLANEALTVQGVVLDAFWVPAKKAGQWTASVTVTDDRGATGSASVVVTVQPGSPALVAGTGSVPVDAARPHRPATAA